MNQSKSLLFLFTGQGAQYPNMLSELMQKEPVFKKSMNQCFKLFQSYHIDLNHKYHSSEVNQTRYTQPALFSVEYALSQLWQSWGISPNLMIGHSIGEIVACTIADVFSLEDACNLVSIRARLMDSIQVDGGMLAILGEFNRFKHMIPETIDIAGYNAQKQIVVSGLKKDLSSFQAQLKSENIRSIPLKVSHPFHSRYMSPMIDEFTHHISSMSFAKPKITIYSNLTSKPYEAFDADYFARHITHPVHFYQSIQQVLNVQDPVMLECGPGPILTSLVKKDHPHCKIIPSCDKLDSSNLFINEAKSQILEEISNVY